MQNQLQLDAESDPNSEKDRKLVKRKEQLQHESRVWDEFIKLRELDETIHIDAASFASLWLTSKLGWAHEATSEGRPPFDQSNFRSQLIRVNNATDPERANCAWCPILRQYISFSILHAAHIFPVKHGELHMRSIFGVRNELFDARNGLLMSEAAKSLFDRGFFAIVPAIEEGADDIDIREWQRGKRPFKIQIFESEAKSMKEPLPVGSGFPLGTKWLDLDNEEVMCLNDSRPRSRYLYFHYLFCLDRALVNGHKNQRNVMMQKEFGRKVWASTGQYIEPSLLRGFAASYGHDFDHPLRNSRGRDDGSEPEYSLTEAFAAQHAAVTEQTKQDYNDVSENASLSSENSCNGDRVNSHCPYHYIRQD